MIRRFQINRKALICFGAVHNARAKVAHRPELLVPAQLAECNPALLVSMTAIEQKQIAHLRRDVFAHGDVPWIIITDDLTDALHGGLDHISALEHVDDLFRKHA